jgi:hypothetical protein
LVVTAVLCELLLGKHEHAEVRLQGLRVLGDGMKPLLMLATQAAPV